MNQFYSDFLDKREFDDIKLKNFKENKKPSK